MIKDYAKNKVIQQCGAVNHAVGCRVTMMLCVVVVFLFVFYLIEKMSGEFDELELNVVDSICCQRGVCSTCLFVIFSCPNNVCHFYLDLM